ncbi:MAG: hypothetical protein ACTIJJ_14565 [Galactobacter sp.]|uniref:hypothetical protein n=1 Tax=Galactobacter sp. TaxID=2676125 RepID=UPI0025BD31BF|nr:hypothetical protein [Galactobacter sp.]
MDVVISLVGLLLIAMVVVVVLLPRVTTAGWAHGSMLRILVLFGWVVAVFAAVLVTWRTDWGFWPGIGIAVAVWALAVASRLLTVFRKANEAGPRRR